MGGRFINFLGRGFGMGKLSWAYRKVGNVPEEYRHEQRVVRPVCLVDNPSLVLKLYDMHVKGGRIKGSLVKKTMGFLDKEIKSGNIKPYIGLGFAILSEDMLNVARWGDSMPYVIKSQLYEFTGDFRDVTRLDLNDAGAFCIWESYIVSHEKDAWRRFLESKRTGSEKLKYLEDFFKGTL